MATNYRDKIKKSTGFRFNLKKQSTFFRLRQTTPGLNASEISEHINKSLRTTIRYIKILQDKDLTEYRGTHKTGGYYLIQI